MPAFPQIPLPLTAGIAPGADPVQPATWNFTDITSDVREYGGVQITAGRSDEATLVERTRQDATLDCRSGNYSRVNPLGAYYGLLDKGTPLQVKVTRIVDTFTRTTSNGLGTEPDSGLIWAHTSASTWSTNGSSALCGIPSAGFAAFAVLLNAAADDVDVTRVSSLSAVTTGAAWVDATVVRYVDTSNFYRLHIEFGLSGVLGVKIAKVIAGAVTDLTSVISTGITYAAGTKIRSRVRAIGPTLQIRVWLDGNAEPSTWNAQVDDDDLSGQAVGVYEWRVSPNSNAGTLTCTIDDFRMDAIRATTPVPEWPVRWSQSGADVTAPISGLGILRRLGQGQPSLRSPISRQLLRYSPAGMWELADESGSTSVASAVSGGRTGSAVDVTFGVEGPPGAAGAVQLNTALSYVEGACSGPNTPDGYAGMIYCKLPSAPGSEANLLWINAAGTATQWRITGDATGFRLYATAADGSAVVTPGGAALYTIDPTKWFAIQLETNVSGGTVNWALIWHQVGGTVFYATTGSFAGTAARTTGFRATGLLGATYSAAWLGDNDLPFVDATFMAVSNGYAGETAGSRLARLAAEEGVPLRIIGDPAVTARMGVQKPGTFLDLARECEAADQGVLHESGGGSALGYLTHRARLNGAAVMTLDFASGHIAAPPEPTDDDQRLRNRINLTRRGGSAVTLSDPVSIAKSGTYGDDLTVNLQADAQLPDHAGWRLHLGTLDDLRWPRIELQLHRNPALIASWCKVRIGSRITIAHPPAAAGGETLDLIVEGWTETLGIYTWDVVLTCSPAKPWQVGVYGDTASRYDSASTSVHGAATSTATSIVFVTENQNETWSTTSVPYEVLVGGERVRVTAMSAPGSSAALVDGGFEAGVSQWIAVSGNLTQSSTFAHTGTFSALLTTTGSPTQAYIRPLLIQAAPVIPGVSYTLSVWVRSAALLSDVRATIDWVDASYNYLSTSDSGSASLASGSWVQRQITVTAPAGAAYAHYGSTVLGSPAAGTLLYTDDVVFTASFVKYQTATVTRSINGVVKAQTNRTPIHIATPGRWALL